MAPKKRIGVLLCGSGHRDGTEIHEATLALLAIGRAGAEAICLAPRGPQRFVLDHITGEEVAEQREMLTESARIARGKVRDITTVAVSDLDALVIPGGRGTGANLSSFVADGAACTVRPDVARLIREIHAAHKPIGAICIAPGTIGRALQEAGISATFTIGTDAEAAKRIEAMGHRHERCPATDCVVDRMNKIASTPAYMSTQSISEAWQGIEKLIAAVIEMG